MWQINFSLHILYFLSYSDIDVAGHSLAQNSPHGIPLRTCMRQDSNVPLSGNAVDLDTNTGAPKQKNEGRCGQEQERYVDVTSVTALRTKGRSGQIRMTRGRYEI